MTGDPKRPAVPVWVPLALFVALFIVGRLWFFVDYPLGAVHPDSSTYLVIGEAIQNGEWPRFGDRSPMVPLMLAAVFSVVDRVMAVVYVQTAVSCLAGMAMIYAVHALRPLLSLPVAMALAAFFMDANAQEHDTAILSESLYTSFLIFSFAGLAMVFAPARWRAWWAAAGSAALAMVIYTKPGGMFVVVIYLMTMAYFLWRRVEWRVIWSYGLPFPLLLLALATYNYRIIGVFALSASDGQEVALITNLYWETSDQYPPEINTAIRNTQALTNQRNTPEELRILNESWDFRQLYVLYLRSHYYGPHAEVWKVTEKGGLPEHRRWLLRLSKDAIAAHPDRFFKHFVVMMAYYYRGVADNNDFRQYLYHRVNQYYVEKHYSKSRGLPYMTRWGKEFADPIALPPAIHITDYDKTREMPVDQRIKFDDTPLTRAYLWVMRPLARIFSRIWWSVGQALVFIIALLFLMRSRFRHDAAFLLFLMVCAPLGNAMTVSLVEYSQPRYSYPLEWVYYVTFICLPLLVSGEGLLPRRSTAK